MKLSGEQLQSGTVRRAREVIERGILGKAMSYLNTKEGQHDAMTLSYLYGSKHGVVAGLSVVFTDDADRLIYWIGPTSALPPNAKAHRPVTS